MKNLKMNLTQSSVKLGMLFIAGLLFFSSCQKEDVSQQQNLEDFISKNYKIDESQKYNASNTERINSVEELNQKISQIRSNLPEINKEYTMNFSDNSLKIDGVVYQLPTAYIYGLDFHDYGGGSGFSSVLYHYIGVQYNSQTNLFINANTHLGGAGSSVLGAQVLDAYNATEPNGKRSMYLTIKITYGVNIGGTTYGIVVSELEYKIVKQTATTFYLYRLF